MSRATPRDIAAAILLAGIVGFTAISGCSAQSRPVANVCHEDEACWNWATMGNHKRGLTVSGKTLVVGPCRFKRLMNNSLHIEHFQSMGKGDDWALKHGCKR